ncbi:hypothetical protein PO909_015836 [Leuciscus waleckii]
MIAEVTMVSSLIKSLPLIVVIMTAGVDGLLDWGVNYSPSYVCALKGSTVKISCTLTNPQSYKLVKGFWTKPVVNYGESPDLCSKPGKRRGIQCNSEYEDTSSITLTNVTEADKHIYYCRFTTDNQDNRWTGIPGSWLDVTDLQVETQQRVKEGDSVTLTCKSSCSLPEQTTFIWYRNTQRITDGTVNQLHLQSVNRSDEGNYSCGVTGHHHLISPAVHLNVESGLRRMKPQLLDLDRVSASPALTPVSVDASTVRLRINMDLRDQRLFHSLLKGFREMLCSQFLGSWRDVED